MSTSGNVLSIDPAQTANNNIQVPSVLAAPEGNGGGNIAGAGTYYSKVTAIEGMHYLSETLFFTGTLAGTITIQVDNSPTGVDVYEQDRAGGAARWQTYDAVNGNGWSNGVATLVAGTISGGTNPGGYRCPAVVPFARLRLKTVITGGAGTIEARRVIKAAGR